MTALSLPCPFLALHSYRDPKLEKRFGLFSNAFQPSPAPRDHSSPQRLHHRDHHEPLDIGARRVMRAEQPCPLLYIKRLLQQAYRKWQVSTSRQVRLAARR